MQTLVEELKLVWPGAVILFGALAFLFLIYKIASPKPWEAVHSILRSKLWLSLDVFGPAIHDKNQPAGAVVTVLARYATNHPRQNGESNRELLSIYERCWSRRMLFWCSDQMLPLFMLTVIVSIVIAAVAGTAWGSVPAVAYLVPMALVRKATSDVSAQVDQAAKSSRKHQKNYLDTNGVSYTELA